MKDSFAFGARVSFSEASIALLPVPWEVTVSGAAGTAEGPLHIKAASHQMDYFTRDMGAFNHRIYFCKPNRTVERLNRESRPPARKLMEAWEKRLAAEEAPPAPAFARRASGAENESALLRRVNAACAKMVDVVYQESAKISAAGKVLGILGGDHSVSEGPLRFLGEKEKGRFGLLHIDAHLDMRKAYQGFERSHASVMRNILCFPRGVRPEKTVHVGIRDFAEEEWEFVSAGAAGQKRRFKPFQPTLSRLRPPLLQGTGRPSLVCFDEDLQKRLFRGETWLKTGKEIIAALPRKVYVSLDVDGLDPSFAPGAGTPVPGGLSFNQTLFLLKEIKRQGKTLIGFDVTETACPSPPETLHNCRDGNAAARLIYILCGLALPPRL